MPYAGRTRTGCSGAGGAIWVVPAARIGIRESKRSQFPSPRSTSTNPQLVYEQVIFSPTLQDGSFIVNTTIPPTTTLATCSATAAGGWTMAINPATGGAFTNSFFADANHNFLNIDNQAVSGIALSGTGSPSVVTSGNNTFIVTQTTTGAGTTARSILRAGRRAAASPGLRSASGNGFAHERWNPNPGRAIAQGRPLAGRSGFSLLELVITMVIVAILASIAIPAYNSYILKSHRTEAKSALLDLASMEERFFSTQNAYSQIPTDLGYTQANFRFRSAAAITRFAAVTASRIAHRLTPAGNPATYCFAATAPGVQANDTACASFALNSQGQRRPPADPNPNVDCWQ